MGTERGYFRIICAVCGSRIQPGKTAYSETIVSVCDHCRGQGRSKPKRSPCRGLKQNAIYELHPRKDHRGVDLISDALPFGRLWYDGPNAASNAIGYAKQLSRSHDGVIRVYDAADNVIQTHEHAGEFKE